MATAQEEEIPDDDPSSEAARTQKTRDKGKPDGLFRACMDSIHVKHTVGQKLRGAALGAGLMTDSRCYAELLAQFYLCTRAMEQRVLSEKTRGDLVRQVAALGYEFTPDYEADLLHLVGGEDWRERVELMANAPAVQYVEWIKTAGEAGLVAAAFILWGPLIIGGGAALKPRVKKAFGAEATHVFEQVVGPGREERKRAFVDVYDSICGADSDAAALRDEIASVAAELMQRNNDLMMACQRSPWWSKYVYAGAGALAAAVGYLALWRSTIPTGATGHSQPGWLLGSMRSTVFQPNGCRH